jgi:phenylpropionate dioxygenase-like ring-hydroxylating dioxygenase large terminal subunit/AcrR family transcriptional regulator
VPSEGASKSHLEPVPERASRVRQRQRLIEACISALHIYGPSRTTVERVVALADLSPGIVRFYFESKAAMLVASLEFLAADFEQRVQLPVTRLQHTPVRALELLVELYLDEDIASPRKVSVWYCFWGEASSRQEYLDICGRKDEDFEILVRELMQRMIEESGERHLDADGVALGLMGVLEIMWQNIAFQNESDIDRRVQKQRALNYLRSIFPRQFAHVGGAVDVTRKSGAPSLQPAAALTRLPAWAYADTALFAAEREQLFRPAWQFAAHTQELARPGDYVAIDLASERALLLRDESGAIRAFHNTCRRRPHALVTQRTGSLDGAIECAAHGLQYGFDGKRRRGETPGDLAALDVEQRGELIFVRRDEGREPLGEPLAAWAGVGAFAALSPRGVYEVEVAADWKLLVEQWLESALAEHPVDYLSTLVSAPQVQIDAATGTVAWEANLSRDAGAGTAGRYTRIVPSGARAVWRRLFIAPNELIEIRPDGALLLQVIPEAPGRCRIRRFDFGIAAPTREQRCLHYLGQRLVRRWLHQDFELAKSIQAGLEGSSFEATEAGPVPQALGAFRGLIFRLLSGIHTPPSEAPLG